MNFAEGQLQEKLQEQSSYEYNLENFQHDEDEEIEFTDENLIELDEKCHEVEESQNYEQLYHQQEVTSKQDEINIEFEDEKNDDTNLVDSFTEATGKTNIFESDADLDEILDF